MSKKETVARVETIQRRIFLIRGEKVVIDADLAEFYGVPTKRLIMAPSMVPKRRRIGFQKQEP